MLHVSEIQIVDAFNNLNIKKGASNTMIDVRACNKPAEKVSLISLNKLFIKVT